MATLKLKPADQGTPEATSTIIEVPQQTTHQLAAKMAPPSDFEGDFQATDVRIPYLSICQKSGNLMDEHPDWLGQFIYDKALALGRSINVVFFKVKKYFEEDLPYGSEGIPQRFDTLAEAREAGVEFKDCANLDLLVEVPAGFDGAEELDGKFYTPARYTVRSTAYGATVKILMKDVSFRLKGGLRTGRYRLEVEKKTNGSNSWFAPKLVADGFSSQEVQAFINERF